MPQARLNKNELYCLDSIATDWRRYWCSPFAAHVVEIQEV
jgi:hypothetical protein